MEHVVSAVATRVWSQTVRLSLQRRVSVGAWADPLDAPGALSADAGRGDGVDLAGLGSAVETLEQLRALDVTATSTKAVLLERCCALMIR